MVVTTQYIGKPGDCWHWKPSPVFDDLFKNTETRLRNVFRWVEKWWEKVIMLSIKTMLGKVLLLFVIFAVIPSAKFSVKFEDYILEQSTENSKVASQINRNISSFNWVKWYEQVILIAFSLATYHQHIAYWHKNRLQYL